MYAPHTSKRHPRDRTTQTLKGSPWELLLVSNQTLQPLTQPPTTIQAAQKPAETNIDEPPCLPLCLTSLRRPTQPPTALPLLLDRSNREPTPDYSNRHERPYRCIIPPSDRGAIPSNPIDRGRNEFLIILDTLQHGKAPSLLLYGYLSSQSPPPPPLTQGQSPASRCASSVVGLTTSSSLLQPVSSS